MIAATFDSMRSAVMLPIRRTLSVPSRPMKKCDGIPRIRYCDASRSKVSGILAYVSPTRFV